MEEKQSEISIKIPALCCAVFATFLYLNTLSAQFAYDDKLVKIYHNMLSVTLILVTKFTSLAGEPVDLVFPCGQIGQPKIKSLEHSCEVHF